MSSAPSRFWGVFEILIGIWCILNTETLVVYGQEGDGCGHTFLSSSSGTLASRNYPGTYPNHTRCEWRLRVPPGHSLRLLFGDFNLEWSEGCSAGSLTITDRHGNSIMGPLCGQLDASARNVSLSSGEVMVRFISGVHRSGRGFLLSYSTNQHPDLISCLHRGTHFPSQQISAFCPAGCKDVPGEIWGQFERGYRDTSVLCRAAVHAGAISDSLGGTVTVSQERGITLYEPGFSNGILSKTGPLSDKRLIFNKDCSGELGVLAYNASSVWAEEGGVGPGGGWLPGRRDAAGQVLPWAASREDREPWLELELWNRSSVTGVITKGRPDFYMESYILLFSKDRKNWKVYKTVSTREKKVFEAHSDGHLLVLNSLFPPVVARYLLLKPQRWHGRASAQVRVLGCPSGTLRLRTGSAGSVLGKGSPTVSLPLDPVTTEGPLIIKSSNESSNQPMILAVAVVLGLALCLACLLAGLWWRRRAKRDGQGRKCCLDKGCQQFHGKTLPRANSELVSYPLTRSVHDALPTPPLNDYAEPDVLAGGQKVGVTFRPRLEEGYTVPFALNHYDTPGTLPEYAEPLPPEPEYATPFSEQPLGPPGPPGPPQLEALQGSRSLFHVLPPTHAQRTEQEQPQYDCPAQRAGASGYSAQISHSSGPRQDSTIYAEPMAPQPTYQEPL